MKIYDHPPLLKLKMYGQQNRGFITDLANHLDVSISYLSQMISGFRPMPYQMAVQVELFSKGEISRLDCRPQDGKKIWPEFFENKEATNAQQASRTAFDKRAT